MTNTTTQHVNQQAAETVLIQALHRIAMNIYGDTVPQNIAGDALDAYRKARAITQQAAKVDEQVPGIPYPTTHADLARITPLQLWQRWVPQDRAITAREAFIAARNIPFVIAPTTSTVSASGRVQQGADHE